MLERLRAREIIRREQLALHLAENDLNLIEPTGLLRQPEDAHFEGKFERSDPVVLLFGRMCRSVIENQVQHPDASANSDFSKVSREIERVERDTNHRPRTTDRR
jgi:hypothetical protein